jgi:membrane protease YdiL (CAAX protease family)
MSILAAAPAGNPENLRGEILFAAVCLVIGLGSAVGLRLWRPAPAQWPERLAWRSSAWPLVAVLGAGLFCWFVLPIGFFTYKQAKLIARDGPGARLDPTAMSATDLAFLATVPPVAGFLALLAGDLALRRLGGYDLGFGLRRLKAGLLGGAMGSVCVVPLLFGFMVLIEWAYRLVRYQHPTEHELLRALGETTDPAVEVPLLAGAALIAPLFEELLFRGHLQTIIRRAFVWVAVERVRQPGDPYYSPGEPAAPAAAMPAGAPGSWEPPPPAQAPVQSGAPEVVAYAVPDTEPGGTVAPRWTVWTAILITSALFAVVHPAWTWPPIFVLSLLLGYAYERTNNLWVPVVIHAAFNSTSTLIYLSGLS